MQQGYRWGKVHAWLLIFTAVFLARPHPAPILTFSIIFLVVLGICVLRRNRLILPLMIAWPATQLLWVLTHPVLAPQRLVIPLFLWCLYFAYYYRRRDEFVRWL